MFTLRIRAALVVRQASRAQSHWGRQALGGIVKRKRDHEPNWAFWGFCLNGARTVWEIVKTFIG